MKVTVGVTVAPSSTVQLVWSWRTESDRPDAGTLTCTVAASFGAIAGAYPAPSGTVAVRSPLLLPAESREMVTSLSVWPDGMKVVTLERKV